MNLDAILKIPAGGDDNIVLIPTGGTFDSKPYRYPSKPPKFIQTLKGDESLLPATVAALPHGGDKVDIARWHPLFEPVYCKDSKYFDSMDIQALAAIIRNDSHRCFVLTHGTDDLAINAEILQKQLGKTDKTVVMVGAMVPLSMHEKHGSDGFAALDHVFEHIGSLPAGVYVAGVKEGARAFCDPSQVDKDWKKSFENLAYTLGPAREYIYAPAARNSYEL